MTRKGEHQSEEHKHKRSLALTGRHLSNEAKIKISLSNKNRHASLETRTKMSLSQKGRHHTLESRNKMSLSAQGKIISDETKIKMSLFRKGKKFKPHTVEARRKISLGVKKQERHGDSESITHKESKEHIKFLFQNIGYTVFLERFISINSKRYVIDVYAIKNNKVLLIEVGRCKREKILELQYKYPIVLQVPVRNGKNNKYWWSSGIKW